MIAADNTEKRARVDALKNGLEKSEQFAKLKDKVTSCSEIDLFLLVDQLGYIIWRTEHDLADGRIEYPEWDKNDKYVLQAEIELSVEQTARFGVQPFEPDTLHPTSQYYGWYRWWKKYIEGMSKEEWDEAKLAIENGGDYSKYRPQGDWKDK